MFTNFVATPNSLVTARWLVHQQLLSTSMITSKWHFWVPKRSSFQRDVPLLRPLHRDWDPRRHLETVCLSHLSHHFSRIFCGIVQSCIILSSRRGIKTYCNNRTRKYVCNTQRLYPLYLHGLTAFKPFRGHHFKDWEALAASVFMISFPPDFLGLRWSARKVRCRFILHYIHIICICECKLKK